MNNNNEELNIKQIEIDNKVNNDISNKQIIKSDNYQLDKLINNEIISKLPEWDIEPPLEIKRRNE